MTTKKEIPVFDIDTTKPVGTKVDWPSAKIIYGFYIALVVIIGLFVLLALCLLVNGDIDKALLSALTGVVGLFFGLIGGSKL